MQENIFMLFNAIAFILLIFSYLKNSKGSRLIFQGIAFIMFTSLALAAGDIRNTYCEPITTNTTTINVNTTAYNSTMLCENVQSFDEQTIWFNTGMAIITGALVFITSLSTMDGQE